MFDRQASPTPKLPWNSLSLSFLTYTTFGWLVYGWTTNREIWLAVAVGVAILGGFVVYPSQSIGLCFEGFFKTDVRALILIILATVISVFLLTYVDVFADALVLSAAGLLVSLDLKIRHWSKPLSLILIIGWQLSGLSMGLLLHYFYLHPPLDLPAYFYADYWIQFLNKLKI